MRQVDIAVIGAGVAGLVAAATAARAGAQVLLIDAMGVGGQVMTVDRIANFPGLVEPVSGYELGPLLQDQAEAAGAQMMLSTVSGIADGGGRLVLDCDEGRVAARAVIVAAGSARRKLGLPGEEALEGRGVSHCASCDGPLFRGQAVLVVGGGDSGFDEALVLADHAAQVTLAFRGAEPRAQRATQAQVATRGNIALRPRTVVEGLEGDRGLTGVRLRDLETGTTDLLPVEGLFVYVGLDPNSAPFAGLVDRDASGRIVTDGALRSSHPRIFAAGDIRVGAAGLLASAAGDGATAALSAVAALGDAA